MAATLIGLVYYADDVNKKVFRKVYPQHDNSELDDPRWTTKNINATRTAVLIKVVQGSSDDRPMTGTQ